MFQQTSLDRNLSGRNRCCVSKIWTLRIRDYITNRCYKWQAYGHVTKYCRAAKGNCELCDSAQVMSLKTAEENPICINCKQVLKPCEHSSRLSHIMLH